MTTDTPRTDAFMASMFEKTEPFTLTLTLDGFARQLERELAEARKDSERYRKAISLNAIDTDMVPSIPHDGLNYADWCDCMLDAAIAKEKP